MGRFDRSIPRTLPGEHVYVVDDDTSTRRNLARMLRGEGYQAFAFASAEDMLGATIPRDVPSCLIVDLRMPGLSGLDLQDLLLEQGLGMSTVFISGRANLQSGIRAMKGGAVDFLEKPFSDTALLEAVRRGLDQDRARRESQSERDVLECRFLTLTPREREVFGLVASGLPNKQVGAQLGTTEKTIKVHRARLMHKMEAQSLAELVRMADRLGPTN